MGRRAIKESIRVRSLDSMEVIVKKIYKAIPFYRTYKEDEVPNFLYFSLLTAQRVGQIRSLEIAHFDLERKICVAPAKITKTGEPYRFPIPDEVIPYLKTIKTGKVFPTIHSSTVDYIYRKLVKVAGIHLVDGKNITAHDTRRLVLYIMTIKLGINSFLADSCLNHKQKSAVVDHYWNHSDEDVIEAFQKYWEYVRDSLFEFEPIIKERSRRRTKAECESLRAVGMMKPKNPNRSYELEKKKRQDGLNRL
jgi:integrase